MGVALVAVLAGLAVGRFLFLTPAASDTAGAPPVAAAPRSLQTIVGNLEADVERDPGDLAAWQSLGLAYVQRAIASSDPAFYELAENALARAERLDPGNATTLVRQGTLALSLHDFRRALDIGRRASAAEPFDAAPLGVLVDAQVELGRYDAAADDLQRMLDLKPNLAALARASYLRELHGDLPGARQAMIAAETAGSGSAFDAASISALVGDLALKAGDIDAADAAYERAEQTSPDIAAAAVGRAKVLAARGDRDAAVDELRAAIERTPQPAAAVLLAHLLRAAGRDAQADDAAEVVRALTALQASAGQIVDLDLAQFEADVATDPDEAVKLARRAWRARPDNVFTNDALGWALHRAGRSKAAVPLVRRATRLDTADVALRYHAAEVLAAAGRNREARRALRGALALDPLPVVQNLDAARRLAKRLEVPLPKAWAATR